ncbi:ABC transporter permease [Actinosynnema sp. NPDC059797]
MTAEVAVRRAGGLPRLVALRLVAGLGVLLAVSAIVFTATELAPGDAATAALGPDSDPASVVAMRSELGLDRPAVVRYLDWLWGAVGGDFGVSYVSHRPVSDVIAERVGNTALLGGLAVVLLVPLAIGLGVWSALRAGRAADRIVSGATLGLVSVPEFVIGTVLVVVFAVQLGVLPAVSFVPPGQQPLDSPEILVLPVVTLLAVCLAHNVRLVRAGVREVSAGDAAENARLNGVPEHRVVLRYVLPSALPPALPVFCRYAGFLLGGALIAETMFGYPGLASALVTASAGRDVPVVQAVALVAAAVTVLLNLLGDVLAVLLDPKRGVTR